MVLHASVRNDHWRQAMAMAMAQNYLVALRSSAGLSADFELCMDALETDLGSASQQISRLG